MCSEKVGHQAQLIVRRESPCTISDSRRDTKVFFTALCASLRFGGKEFYLQASMTTCNGILISQQEVN